MKQIYTSVILLVVINFLYSCGVNIPEAHSLNYDHKTFDSLAKYILLEKKIYAMDDFSRYHKSINEIAIKLSEKDENQNAQFLNIVEDSLSLEPKVVSHLRIQLEDTKLRDFYRSGDSILFTVDGLLDNAWGFMYCSRETKMDSIWFNFHGNSIKYVENINKNWKRVSIR